MGIVTDGLVLYLNSKKGVIGNYIWQNLAPKYEKKYPVTIEGATVTPDGMYFDGVDDRVRITTPTELLQITDLTIEYRIRLDSWWQWINAIMSYPDYDDFIMLQSSDISICLPDEGYRCFRAYYPNVWDFGEDDELYISMTYRHNIDYFELFVNGVTFTIFFSDWLGADGGSQIFQRDSFYLSSWSGWDSIEGILDNFRLYNRALSPDEIYQNYLVGRDIGLDGGGVDPEPEIPTNPPDVVEISANRYKISSVAGFNDFTVNFKFDTDITNWTVNLSGVSHDTGTVLGNGSTKKVNEEIVVTIDWTKLQEGINRINIYGKNEKGWTPYGGGYILYDGGSFRDNSFNSTIDGGDFKSDSIEIIDGGVFNDTENTDKKRT